MEPPKVSPGTELESTSSPQLPFKIPHIPSNRDHKALNGGTLGGLGRACRLLRMVRAVEARVIRHEGSVGIYTILYHTVLYQKYHTIPYHTRWVGRWLKPPPMALSRRGIRSGGGG